jgi:hypothetical protein
MNTGSTGSPDTPEQATPDTNPDPADHRVTAVLELVEAEAEHKAAHVDFHRADNRRRKAVERLEAAKKAVSDSLAGSLR